HSYRRHEQPTNPEYTTVISEWAGAGMKYVSSVMVDGVEPKVALRAYLETVMAFNPQITLDFMNAKLGKASAQNYSEVWNSVN
ncbi:MAG: hypothetical protein WC554_12070, partial [Clostridia bacterium]